MNVGVLQYIPIKRMAKESQGESCLPRPLVSNSPPRSSKSELALEEKG